MAERRPIPRTALCGLLLALALGRPVRAAADETLSYTWRLDGFLGALAGLFFPNSGEGRLTLEHLPDGHLKSELRITSERRAEGDYFLYGAEWDPATGTTLKAWSGQRWRGEEKSEEQEVHQSGVIDVATAIYSLRRDPPRAPRQLEIWSDGRLYPVIVFPRGLEQRRLGGSTVAARHYAVRGVDLPGRRQWKGELDLWLALDDAATPVEILVARSAARVHLELVGRTAVSARPDGKTPEQ
jgi:Protein of unknown function (DUF3108)